MPKRSIGTPLTIGIVLAVLLVALAVGWQVLLWSDVAPPATPLDDGLSTRDWVLWILGSIFFALVLIGLVWLCAWLVREMRVNQSQRAFLDAVTHEMKTPLASFRLYLDTLGRLDVEPGKRAEFIDHMREDLDRLDGTIDQVLAAARADERGRSARREPVDVVGVLAECVDRVRERHGLAEEAVRLENGTGTLVRGDRGELEMVFRNLLENAIKYSEDPVEVRVRIRSANDTRVTVEIADRGIGIPQGDLSKIFQRFYRARRDVQRKASGLGLGLFIVGNLVRRQGGRIEARSEGAGRGSRFVVTLRAARGHAAAGAVAHRQTSLAERASVSAPTGR
ncbi:MAG: sensor histidine kinase [Myxococcota bacterium]